MAKRPNQSFGYSAPQGDDSGASGGGGGDFELPPAGDSTGGSNDSGDEGQSNASAQLTSALDAFTAKLGEMVNQSASVQSTDGTDYAEEGNIVGAGISDGGENGLPGEPSMVVFTVEDTDEESVRQILSDTMGVQAASDDSFPITVHKTGVIEAQSHRFKMRPAPCGVSVGHFRITAGTLGALAVGRTAPRTNRLLVLSNNHVLANSNNAAINDNILQQGPFDGGANPADRIALLERWVPINFAGGANFVDAATGWAWPNLVRKEFVYLQGGQPRFFRIGNLVVNPVLGLNVAKTGRTTQLTSGRIVAYPSTIRVNYGGGRVALFTDQITIRSNNANPFSAGGDSGSLIWTADSRRAAVGLLFAGGGGLTFANRITRVLTALDIRLIV
ncbi:hypothetical protein LBMAG48_07770 [Phycisphaerae bacterium]|jgi:hypothetical protein|nr:hypothetical protein LBMAG48_07770 [Phycisphaerae bacterium]